MKPTTDEKRVSRTRLLLLAMVALVSLAPTAYAAAPGITGPSFNLPQARHPSPSLMDKRFIPGDTGAMARLRDLRRHRHHKATAPTCRFPVPR